MSFTAKRPFTLYLEYAATGEGLRRHISVLSAIDESQARTLFLAQHCLAADYFGRGVDVFEGVRREVLMTFFNTQFLDQLEARVQSQGMLIFNWSFNMS